MEKQVRKIRSDQRLLFSNIDQLQRIMNEFFARFLRLEEWIPNKERSILIPKVALMQYKPPPPPRATTVPSSSKNSSPNMHDWFTPFVPPFYFLLDDKEGEVYERLSRYWINFCRIMIIYLFIFLLISFV
ncbi:hypothetical protein AAZX31_15G186000 [Glycine max]